jgi:DNA-binding CsgD family transcriptional regulator
MGKKTNRSNGYQHLFAEQSYSNEMMAEFSEAQGLIENYTPEDKEQLMTLREELRLAFWRLAKDNLTARQYQVLELLAKGNTQIEVSKILGVNQSSITKSVNGNCDYSNSKRKVYGGCKKRMRKLSEKDEQIQKLFAQIADIHSQY